MNARSVETIVGALNEANVRYLIVGGLAVVAHGFLRFTSDIDLALDPDPQVLSRATAAFESLGYRPRAPVQLAEFLDPVKRREWAREKGMTVFTLNSLAHAETEVDLFVEAPFEFEQAYANAVRIEVAAGLVATFVSRQQLIAMKRQVGRPQDLEDVSKLEADDIHGAPQ